MSIEGQLGQVQIEHYKSVGCAQVQREKYIHNKVLKVKENGEILREQGVNFVKEE